MAELNKSDGDVLTSGDIDDIDEQLTIQCTSASRPTGIEGRFIAETDTDKLMSYDGSGWRISGGFGWQSFTPSWTNFSIGNGTQAGEYRYTDGGMHVVVNVTLGSTSSVSGSLTLTLPNSETFRTSAIGTRQPLGSAIFQDDTGSPAVFQGIVRYGNSTSVIISALNASATYLSHTATSSTIPFTWATSDLICVTFFAPLT